MRNDFDKEISFEQLMNNKIDSIIEHSDGTKEPANTFFYGILNDSSMIETEFDKYMSKGAWRDLDTFITSLHNPNISKEQFDMIFKEAKGMIAEFADIRMKDKYKEAIARNGQNVPSLENKINIIRKMTENELGQEQAKQQATSVNNKSENKLTLKQKVAHFLQRNNLFMNLSFVDKFVRRQLDVLPPAIQENRTTNNVKPISTRQDFLNQLTNFGQYRNLPPIQRMSDPEKLARMQRIMKENQQTNDENEK